jgi:hypothetical protein
LRHLTLGTFGPGKLMPQPRQVGFDSAKLILPRARFRRIGSTFAKFITEPLGNRLAAMKGRGNLIVTGQITFLSALTNSVFDATHGSQ